MKARNYLGIAFAATGILTAACTNHSDPGKNALGSNDHGANPATQHHLKYVTLLATNDLHGGLEASLDSKGRPYSGMALLSGAFQAIRQGVQATHGENGGVLVLDSGDQFQGTLVSNYNEGVMLYQSMIHAGYDAAILGNHDYDFGPVGWKQDKVDAGLNPQPDPSAPNGKRGALMKLVDLATQGHLSLISANTYLQSSLVDTDKKPVAVKNSGCTPKVPNTKVDWSQAARPDYVKPYVIKQVAGLRVALIGIDFIDTQITTTPDNVSDLCFRDEFDSYTEVRDRLEGQADLYIMLIHNGAPVGSSLAQRIAAQGPNRLHAVLAGHTHRVEKVVTSGIPVIQDGANGQYFGRVDLVWDADAKQVDTTQTQAYSGLEVFADQCDPYIAKQGTSFCSVIQGKSGPQAAFDHVAIEPDSVIADMIQQERQDPDFLTIAHRKLGHASQAIPRDRLNESPLADLISDEFRKDSGADVALINTGGIRADLPSGDIDYEDFFRVVPFNNRGVVLGPMSVQTLFQVLTQSLQSCGSNGPLMQSGLVVTFDRDCTRMDPQSGLDPQGHLVSVALTSGEVIMDPQHPVDPNRTLYVATLDFLAAGGSGYSIFQSLPQFKPDLGIVRDLVADSLAAALEQGKGELRTQTDGRWVDVAPSPSPSPSMAPLER